jgi:hypothetical protein
MCDGVLLARQEGAHAATTAVWATHVDFADAVGLRALEALGPLLDDLVVLRWSRHGDLPGGGTKAGVGRWREWRAMRAMVSLCVRQTRRALDEEKLSNKATMGGVWRIQRGQQGGRERRLNV